MAELAANLTNDQIDDFRRVWIRDEYDASGLPITPVVQLSEYNRSRKAEFFSDAQLQAIYDRVVQDWAEELAAIQYEKETERTTEGDDAATATITGDAIREQACLRLMRVWCRRQMAEDPGYRASLGVGMKTPDAILAEWTRQNTMDLAWVRARSGQFNAIEIERA